MPNHVENELYVRGPQAERDNFFNAAEGHEHGIDSMTGQETSEVNELDFNSFIPYPKEYKDQDLLAGQMARDRYAMEPAQREAHIKEHGWPKDGYNQGGYDWCVHTWGTKWNAYSIRRKENKTSIRYDFQTAWSPPIKVINAMAHMFPTLTFVLRYFEMGVGFQGRYVIKGDEIIEDTNKKYYGHRGG